MKAALATLLLATSGAAQVWKSAFPPPFTTSPMDLMLGIDCVSDINCFILGSHGNDAFGVYQTSDPTFQTLNKIPIYAREPPIFLLGIGMQDATKGVVGGVEIGVGGLYYTVNGREFNESLNVGGIVATQAVYNIGHNTYAMVGSEGSNNGVAVSTDGGRIWRGHWWPKNDTRLTNAPSRYGAFPSDDAWYVTGGAFPTNNTQLADGERFFSEQWIVNSKSGKLRRRSMTTSQTSRKLQQNPAYAAVIAKSTDQGATWQVQYYDENRFSFNQISCGSATVCVAVGEGMSDGSTEPGARFFRTADGGATWNQTFFSSGESSTAVKMVSATEGWATLAKSSTKMMHTTDGGATWTPPAHAIPLVVAVMMMDFTSPARGYAVAITELEVCTILTMGM